MPLKGNNCILCVTNRMYTCIDDNQLQLKTLVANSVRPIVANEHINLVEIHEIGAVTDYCSSDVLSYSGIFRIRY